MAADVSEPAPAVRLESESPRTGVLRIMARRANWKGFLRLSLVTCPVALYPATSETEKISFNQLNRATVARPIAGVAHRRTCFRDWLLLFPDRLRPSRARPPSRTALRRRARASYPQSSNSPPATWPRWADGEVSGAIGAYREVNNRLPKNVYRGTTTYLSAFISRHLQRRFDVEHLRPVPKMIARRTR